jgi:hypothetical protein
MLKASLASRVRISPRWGRRVRSQSVTADTIRGADLILDQVDLEAGPHHAIVAQRARDAAFDEIRAPLRRGLSLARFLSVQGLRSVRLTPRGDRR